jgi:hypothetical protein
MRKKTPKYIKQALKYFFEQIYFWIWNLILFGEDSILDLLLKKIKIVNLHENGETLLGEMRFQGNVDRGNDIRGNVTRGN